MNVVNQYPRQDPKPGEPRPPSRLTCQHWWPRAEGGGICAKAAGSMYNVTQPDEWCREHQPRGLRGVPNRQTTW